MRRVRRQARAAKDDNQRRSVTVWRFIIKKQNRSRGFYEARGILKTVEDQSTVAGTTQAILEALGR